jgi:hypothetical protein
MAYVSLWPRDGTAAQLARTAVVLVHRRHRILQLHRRERHPEPRRQSRNLRAPARNPVGFNP